MNKIYWALVFIFLPHLGLQAENTSIEFYGYTGMKSQVSRDSETGEIVSLPQTTIGAANAIAQGKGEKPAWNCPWPIVMLGYNVNTMLGSYCFSSFYDNSQISYRWERAQRNVWDGNFWTPFVNPIHHDSDDLVRDHLATCLTSNCSVILLSPTICPTLLNVDCAHGDEVDFWLYVHDPATPEKLIFNGSACCRR